MAVYRHYDQQSLDHQYNNRAAVPGFERIVNDWRERSKRFRQRVSPILDIAYGPGAREQLDVFPASRPGAPVQVFFHGGYWQAMDKEVFHFVAESFVSEGAVTVLVNYPLAPHHSMDEIVASCRRAIAWLYHNVARYHGDPDRIHVSGHSAGGHLAAMLMATDWQELAAFLPVHTIKSGCAVSGLFDLEPIRLSYLNQVLALDEIVTRRNSPVLLEPGSQGSFTVAVGELESDEYHAQSEHLARAWNSRKLAVRLITLADTHHFSALDHLADRRALLFRAVWDQMWEVSRDR